MNEPLRIDALEDMALEFRRLAMSPEAQPARRRWSFRRPLVGLIVGSLMITSTAAAGVLLLSEGEPIRNAPAEDVRADQRPLVGSDRLTGVQTADPQGGPDWGMRLSQSESGKTCYAVGRVVDGRIGLIIDGTFRALPLRGPGYCSTLNQTLPYTMNGTTVGDDGASDERSAIYGLALPTVRSITFDDGRSRRTVEPNSDGAYLAVFDGRPSVTRTFTYTDGQQEVIRPPR